MQISPAFRAWLLTPSTHPDVGGSRRKAALALVETLETDELKALAFNPDQPRDEQGQWTDGGVKSPAFKQWFDRSKVVNADGTPKVMYHAASGAIDEFRPFTHFGTQQAANDRAEILSKFYDETLHRSDRSTGSNVIPVYLKVENPLRMPDLAGIDSTTGEPLPDNWDDAGPDDEIRYPRGWEGEEAIATTLLEMGTIDIDEFEEHRSNAKALDLLRAKGYDGIVYQNIVEDAGSDSWIVFDHTQIRSKLSGRILGGPGSGNFDHAGRPGEVGGSAPQGAPHGSDVSESASGVIPTGAIDFETVARGMSPAVAAGIQAEGQKLFDLSFGDPENVHETLNFIDLTTGRAVLAQPVHGDIDGVMIPDYQRYQVDLHGDPGNLLPMHTHPSGSAFSPQDFDQVLAGKHHGAMVLGKDGSVYEIRMNRQPGASEIEGLRDDLRVEKTAARAKTMAMTDAYVSKTYGVNASPLVRTSIARQYPEIELQHKQHWIQASDTAWQRFANRHKDILSYRRTPGKKVTDAPLVVDIPLVKAAAETAMRYATAKAIAEDAAYVIDDTETTSVYALNGAPARRLRAARTRETALHRAADAHVAKLSVAVRYAFALGRRALRPLLASMRTLYDPDQPRDEQGQWASSGSIPTAKELENDPNFFESLVRAGDPPTDEPYIFLAPDVMDVHRFGYPGQEQVALGVMFKNPLRVDSAEEASIQLLGKNVYPDTSVIKARADVRDVLGAAIKEADRQVALAGRVQGYDAIIRPVEIQVLDKSLIPPMQPLTYNDEEGGYDLPGGNPWGFGQGFDAYIERVRTKQIKGLAFNPDQPRDEQGQWTAGGDTRATSGAGASFPRVGDTVDGRVVLDRVPNEGSIESSLTDYEVLPGIREVQMSSMDPAYQVKPYSKSESDRLDKLQAEIEARKEIAPLIIVVDKDKYPYILEGGHRFDALRRVGAKSFPARVVLDRESLKTLGFPDQPRDDQGQWTSGATTFFHGTTEQRLTSILKTGINASYNGAVWPGKSIPGHVYMTSDLDGAKRWAESASRHAAPGLGVTLVPTVLQVEIPAEESKAFRLDANTPDSRANVQYAGDIKPEWIKGAWSRQGPFSWDPKPPWVKVLAEATESLYLPFALIVESRTASASPSDVVAQVIRGALASVLPKTLLKVLVAGGEVGARMLTMRHAEFNPDQPRDEQGQWTSGGANVKVVYVAGDTDILVRNEAAGVYSAKDDTVYINERYKGNEHLLNHEIGHAIMHGATQPPMWAKPFRNDPLAWEEFKSTSVGKTYINYRGGRGDDPYSIDWVEAEADLYMTWKAGKLVDAPRVIELIKSNLAYAKTIKEGRVVVLRAAELRTATFDPDQPRDEQGQWTTAYHGTISEKIESIKKNGLKREFSGAMYPGMSRKDSVYVTNTREDAEQWARLAVDRLDRYDFQQQQNNTKTRSIAAVIEVHIPKAEAAHLRPDRHFGDDRRPGNFEFAGDIKPEWIKGVRVQNENTWEWKAAAAGADVDVLYVVVLLTDDADLRTAVFNPDQPRDEQGQWTSGADLGPLYRGEGGLGAKYVGKQWGEGSTYATTDLMLASIYGKSGMVHGLKLPAHAKVVDAASERAKEIAASKDPTKTAAELKVDVIINKTSNWIGEVAPHEVIIFSKQLASKIDLTPQEKADAERYSKYARMKTLGDLGSVRESISQMRTARDTSPPRIKFRFDAKNQHAVDWADRHAAELIDGISETSREAINNAIAEALESGDFGAAVEDILAAVGDERRAELIARNETMVAVHEGQREAWDQAVGAGLLTGDEKREWIVVGDEKTCPICLGLEGKRADLDGHYVGDDGEEYDGPPAHVSCRCTEGLTE